MLTTLLERGLTYFNSKPELQKKILSGGFWAALVKALSMPLNLAVVGLLARLLAPEDMGIYFLAFSLITAASSLGMLGMGDTMVRLVASSLAIGDTFTARKSIQYSISWGIVGAFIIGIILTIFGSNFGLPTNVVVLVSFWGIAQTGLNLIAEALRSFNDIRSATIFQNRTLSNALIAAILFAIWIYSLAIDLRDVFSIIAIVSTGALLSGAIFLWRKVNTNTSKISVSEHAPPLNIFSQALPVLAVTSMNMIRAQVGIWIVASFLSNEEIALYGSANRLVYLVSVPLSTIVNALIPPIIAELYAKKEIRKLERTVRKLATSASIVAFVLTTILIVGGDIILDLIFGDFYTKAWLVLAILALSQLIGVSGGSCGVTLIMTGHQKALMKITTASAAAAVATTYIGAQLYGMVGVAIAMVLVILFQNTLMVFSAKKNVGIWTHIKLSWK